MHGRCRSSPHAGSPVERPQGFGAPAARRTGAAAATGSHEQPWKCGAGCTDLPRREVLLAEVRGPCVPHDLGMQAWLQTVYMRRVAVCDSRDLSMAYLIRAVQSPEYPVPLVLGKELLLGIFPIASRDSRLPLMGNRCRSRRNLTSKGARVAEIRSPRRSSLRPFLLPGWPCPSCGHGVALESGGARIERSRVRERVTEGVHSARSRWSRRGASREPPRP